MVHIFNKHNGIHGNQGFSSTKISSEQHNLSNVFKTHNFKILMNRSDKGEMFSYRKILIEKKKKRFRSHNLNFKSRIQQNKLNR